MIINGHKVPDPAREPLKRGKVYYMPHVTHPNNPIMEEWSGHALDHDWLAAGLIHTRRTAAQAHARALVSITAKP